MNKDDERQSNLVQNRNRAYNGVRFDDLMTGDGIIKSFPITVLDPEGVLENVKIVLMGHALRNDVLKSLAKFFSIAKQYSVNISPSIMKMASNGSKTRE